MREVLAPGEFDPAYERVRGVVGGRYGEELVEIRRGDAGARTLRLKPR